MEANFTMHIQCTERNVTLTTDTETMKGVPSELAINIFRMLENTRKNVKNQIDKFYSLEGEGSPEAPAEARSETQQNGDNNEEE